MQFFPKGTAITKAQLLDMLNEHTLSCKIRSVDESQLTEYVCQKLADGLFEAKSEIFDESESVAAENAFMKKMAFELSSELEYPSSAEFTDDWHTILHILGKPAFMAWMKESDEGEMGSTCVDNGHQMVDAMKRIEAAFDSMC